ncbi:MAG TPA: long-chain fatty acid--CoA ligase [Acidimicrobiales bacterium]|nr:long-chain fatty acid--CoA ligase [Acidimicrobiales bacterium]
MLSTMQDAPLLVSGILRHGQQVYGSSSVVTITGPDGEADEATFLDVAERSERLASALTRLGIGDSDRVGTFLWNNQTHLEAYLGIPAMGAVLHTLNIRLFPEQLAYVVNHAEDKAIIVDASLIPLLARVRDQLTTVKHIIVAGAGDTDALGATFGYEELLGAEEPGFDWPELDERQAAAMCYTTGTTGNPKGVAYSHRSTFLHSMAITSASSLGINEQDRVLSIVPMFHANAWGTPYGAFFTGADMVMPQQFLQAAPLAAMIARHRPTLSAGVPTIWNDLMRYAESNPVDLSSLRAVTVGGAAVPRHLIEQFDNQFGIKMVQGWGMTETSPLCALAIPPKGTPPEEEMDWRAKTGRVVPGVEIRICAEDGTVLPRDGETVGEFEVRGPWIAASYYGDPSPERFHDGWLRTGDVGSLDGKGFMQISDRTKDVIKSGGEWISSVELENEVMAHPGVFEAAVVAVPDPKWSERPMVAVVRGEGSTVSVDELVDHLQGRVSKWWVPERWTFIDELPKTSVGKFDKKVIRAQHADGKLEVIEIDLPSASSGK